MSSDSRNIGHAVGQAYKTFMGGGDGSRRGGRRDGRRGGRRGGGRGHGGVDKSGRNCRHCNSPYHLRKDCPHRDRPRFNRGRQAALPTAEARAALPAPESAAPSAASTPAVTATAPAATTAAVTSAATSAAPTPAPAPAATSAAPTPAPAPAATSAAPTPAPSLAQAPSELSSSTPPAPPSEIPSSGSSLAAVGLPSLGLPSPPPVELPAEVPLAGEIHMSEAPGAPAEPQANEGLAVSATTPAQQEFARMELIFRVSTETGLSAADARSMLFATEGNPEVSIRLGTMLFRVLEETGMHSEAAFNLLTHARWDMSTVPLALSYFWPDGVIPDEHLRPSVVEARRQRSATMHESRQIEGPHEEEL